MLRFQSVPRESLAGQLTVNREHGGGCGSFHWVLINDPSWVRSSLFHTYRLSCLFDRLLPRHLGELHMFKPPQQARGSAVLNIQTTCQEYRDPVLKLPSSDVKLWITISNTGLLERPKLFSQIVTAPRLPDTLQPLAKKVYVLLF